METPVLHRLKIRNGSTGCVLFANTAFGAEGSPGDGLSVVQEKGREGWVGGRLCPFCSRCRPREAVISLPPLSSSFAKSSQRVGSAWTALDSFLHGIFIEYLLCARHCSRPGLRGVVGNGSSCVPDIWGGSRMTSKSNK